MRKSSGIGATATLVVVVVGARVRGLVPSSSVPRRSVSVSSYMSSSSSSSRRFLFEEDDDDDAALFGALSSASASPDRDLSGGTVRRFALGRDVVLEQFVGSLGFDEVTDWEYYLVSEEDGRRAPAPFDPSAVRRTRESSGGVVRVFRGELVGRVGAARRSRGEDARVTVREFSGPTAANLATRELECVGRLQTEWLSRDDDDDADDANAPYAAAVRDGEWYDAASSRWLSLKERDECREDDGVLSRTMTALSSAPFVAVLGQLDLTDCFEEDPSFGNEWYRALSVPPPKPGSSVLVVYEYAGLSTLAAYCDPPPVVRHAKLPPRRGLFNNPIPPEPMPSWEKRADYVVRGVLRQTLEAVAVAHESGVAHRSLGRSSVVLSSPSTDVSLGANLRTTDPASLRVKLSDLGFGGRLDRASEDDALRRRARAFGIGNDDDDDDDAVGSALRLTDFAVAEDLHALGYVFAGVLLTTLAEPPPPSSNNGEGLAKSMKTITDAVDEDGLRRLLGEIFEYGEMDEFRDYCRDEEAWTRVVRLLDEHDGAGWDLLEKLCFARERAGRSAGDRLTTARGLLSNPLFARRR